MPGAIQFERLVSIFEADLTPLERAVNNGIRLVDKFENKVKNAKFTFGGTSGTGFSRSVDREMRAAEADVRRFERERARMEREYTRAVEREARLRHAARNREQRQAANDFLAHMRRVQNEERKASFMGGLGGRMGMSRMMGMGAGAAAAIGLPIGLAAIASEGREAYMALDKLVRYTATLDQSFQSPRALTKLRKDIEALSLEVPQSAEDIAKASFSIKSAFQDLSEPQLIEWLRKFSIAATASNTTVDLHADRLASLAKLYKVTANDADQFFAVLKTSFGDALSQDAQVAEGFQRILVPARQVKQEFLEVAVAMGSIQSATGDAEGNTTNLLNVYSKLSDPKYIEAFKSMGVEVFDQTGKHKQLNQIVNEVAKSLEGLTDAQKAEKLGAFRDLQFRAGLMSLLEVLDQYNARLGNAKDMQAFENSNKVMLDSAEARWAKFANKIEQVKRDIGEGVASPITQAQGSQSDLGSATIFAEETARQGLNALMSIQEPAARMSAEFYGKILGLSPQTMEKIKQRNKTLFDSLRSSIDTQSHQFVLQLLQNEKKQNEALAGDPSQTAAVREAAVGKIKLLTAAIAQQSEKLSQANFENFRISAEMIGKGFEAGAPGAQQKAVELQKQVLDAMKAAAESGASKETIEAYRQLVLSIGQAIGEADVASAGQNVGQSLTTGISAGIATGTPAIATAGQTAITSGAQQVDAGSPGSTLGQQFAAGVANGIRSGAGPIGAAVAGIIDWAFSSGKQAAESHSPSERAARELGVPFAQGIAKGISDPKSRKAVKQSIKELYDDLMYEAGRIDPEASKAKAAVERFYSSLLMDQSVSFDEQIDRVVDYYNEIYRVEADSYRKRLANISAQEAAIRARKDIKPDERRRQLRALADARGDTEAGWADTSFNLNANKNRGISDISQREIERGMAAFKRQMSRDRFGDIGLSRTATQQAQRDHEDRLALIDEEIRKQEDLRDSSGRFSETYATAVNKITELEEQRKDAVVEGEQAITEARHADKQSLIDLQASIADFARQSKEIEFDAAQAKIEVMRATGASQTEIFAAEQALSRDRENFRHEEFMRELKRERDRLLAADTSGKERLRIEATYNQLLEAESKRHQGALDQIAAQQSDNSILGQWKKIGAQLPTYKDQLRQFAIGIPEVVGGAFGQALQGMDGTWKGFLTSLKQAFFQSITQMLAELARAQLIKGLTSLLGSLFGGLGGGTGGGGGNGQFGWALAGYAEGGQPEVGRAAWVGERGPELFVPQQAGRILSHEDSMKAVSGGRGGQTVINNTVVQNFKTPRALTAPKSVRQQAQAATAGMMMATRKN
jgi:TP901 family phage tail tape measure protein